MVRDRQIHGSTRVVRRAALLLSGAFAIFLAYLLSYAPIVRLKLGSDEANGSGYMQFGFPVDDRLFGETISVYRPVEWLLDHPPLEGRLRKWESLWGVRCTCQCLQVGRMFDAPGVRERWQSLSEEVAARKRNANGERGQSRSRDMQSKSQDQKLGTDQNLRTQY